MVRLVALRRGLSRIAGVLSFLTFSPGWGLMNSGMYKICTAPEHFIDGRQLYKLQRTCSTLVHRVSFKNPKCLYRLASSLFSITLPFPIRVPTSPPIYLHPFQTLLHPPSIPQ